MKTKIPDELFEASEKPPHRFHLKRCRVKVPDKTSIPIVGGSSAFDAVFDWDLMAAVGRVDGHEVVVGIQQGVISFYKDQ